MSEYDKANEIINLIDTHGLVFYPNLNGEEKKELMYIKDEPIYIAGKVVELTISFIVITEPSTHRKLYRVEFNDNAQKTFLFFESWDEMKEKYPTFKELLNSYNKCENYKIIDIILNDNNIYDEYEV